MHVDVFTQGKTKDKNEDFFGYDDTTFVVADGATDKSGKIYDGKTGGEIVSDMIVKTCLSSKLNGTELVDQINTQIAEIYKTLEITKDTTLNAKYRFSGTFVCLRRVGTEIIITALGDVGYRLNGVEAFTEQKQIDTDNAKIRATYIKNTGDVTGSRRLLYPHLIKQFAYQNIPSHILGYGAIDGTPTPEKYVNLFYYPASLIKTIEIFTDGYYYSLPKTGQSIQDWEEMIKKIDQEDPHKYKTYKSTKSLDDRTVMTIDL
jgi:hypothetical protein